MNHDGGNQPRTTALLTAVAPTPTASAMALRPMASARSSAVVMAVSYPQFVEPRKPTIGGLPNASHSTKLRAAMRGDAVAQSDYEFAPIGNRLRRVRTLFSDMNQREWAEKHAFQMTQWNNWENGSRRIPVEASEKLCNLYGLTLDFIYRGRVDGLAEKASKLL